jgi:hypothetical protein
MGTLILRGAGMWDKVFRCAGGLSLGIGLCMLVVGCGPPGPTRLKMKFDVSRKANDDNPVQVDVVVAYDPELVDELDRLTAKEWFAQRDQRLRNNPGQQNFNSWRWELTPGVEVPNIELPLRGVPGQGLLFADYFSRGKHSARFDPRLAQTVQFRHDAFRLVPGKPNEPESSGWRPPVGWSTFGLGVVGIGLGVMFTVFAADAAEETQGLRPKDAAKHAQLVDDFEDYELGLIISYSVGAALVLAGSAILLWPESNESPFREIPDSDSGTNATAAPW